MARMKENPRYNVISMRISEEERRQLETIMKKSHKSVSHIMREAVEYFAVNHEHINLSARLSEKNIPKEKYHEIQYKGPDRRNVSRIEGDSQGDRRENKR